MIARSLVLAGQLNMGPVILFHLLTEMLELKVFLGFDVVVKVKWYVVFVKKEYIGTVYNM